MRSEAGSHQDRPEQIGSRVPAHLKFDAGRLTAKRREVATVPGRNMAGEWRGAGTSREAEKTTREEMGELPAILAKQNKSHLLPILLDLPNDRKERIAHIVGTTYRNPAEARADNYQKVIKALEGLLGLDKQPN